MGLLGGSSAAKVAPLSGDVSSGGGSYAAAASASSSASSSGPSAPATGGRNSTIKIDSNPEFKDLYRSQLKEPVQEGCMLHLPRGGTVVSTRAGDIQFGIPPETIKDSMKLGLTVPTYFVILGEMFDRQAGINMAEFEFPAYFNFFCLKKKVTLICMPDLEARVRAIFTETLLGPAPEDCCPAEDHGGACDASAVPNFREEGYYLDGMRRSLSVDTLVQFLTFDARAEVTIGDNQVRIKYDTYTKSFRVIDIPNKSHEIAKIVERFTYLKVGSVPDSIEQLAKVPNPTPFSLPNFGVTVLGSSHGFDPNGSTTGFVIWVNGHGLMVDPPPGSSQALERLSIPTRFIEGIILSHCHADHDAGTFQKILKEQSVNIFTTTTIFNSFMRKYSAISGFGIEFLTQLFSFKPVQIGVPFEFYGAKFHFFYSFHTIPCVGFQVEFEGETFVYSADTNSSPDVIEKMFAEGSIGKQRRDMLVDHSPLKAGHSLVFHEAGVPPIHTPMKLLTELDAAVKERMYIVHVTPSMIPADSGLKQANVFDTLSIEMEGGNVDNSVIRYLESIDFLSSLPREALEEIAGKSVRKVYERDALIIDTGAKVDTLVFVTAGRAIEASTDGIVSRMYSPGDYTGEIALVLGDAAVSPFKITAGIVTHTLEVSMSFVTPHVTDATLLAQITEYAALQSDGTWMAVCQNMVMKDFTNIQRKDFLQGLLEVEVYEEGESIDIQSCGVLVIEGYVQCLLDPSTVEDEDDLSTYRGKNRGVDFIDQSVPPGSFLSDINSVLNDKPTYVQCEALSEVKLRRLPRTKLIDFLVMYPGLMVQLLDTRILTLEDIW